VQERQAPINHEDRPEREVYYPVATPRRAEVCGVAHRARVKMAGRENIFVHGGFESIESTPAIFRLDDATRVIIGTATGESESPPRPAAPFEFPHNCHDLS
jgi:hypothetical protein